MSEISAGRPQARPLLTGGEKLREAIEVGRPGGGAKNYPISLAESVASLILFTESAIAASELLPREFRGARVILEATLRPEFLANSYFPSDLLRLINAESIGSRFATATRHATATQEKDDHARTKTLFLSADDSSLERLGRLLNNPFANGVSERARQAIQAVDRIELSTARSALPAVSAQASSHDDATAVWEAVLHPEPDRSGRVSSASSLTRERWAELVLSRGGSFDEVWIRQSAGFTYIPVALSENAVVDVQRFNGLRQIAPMPHARHLEEVVELPEPFLFERPKVDAQPSRPLRVAVFDGGVDANSPYWAGRVSEKVLGTILPDHRADDHGAIVTSALLYGPEPSEPLIPANLTIDHYRSWPQAGQDDYEMYWLLDEIKAAVLKNDYQVVVVATAPQKFVEDDYIDRWTHELDQLAHDHNVLFVTAAGNNGANRPQYGQNKILLPADMVNGMAIGASTSLTGRASRAPFSAVGPGRPGGRVRPDGLAFGGTQEKGFRFLRNDGTLSSTFGTSASAPSFVHGLADLVDRIGHLRVSPVTLRAFSAHFAEPAAKDQGIADSGHGLLRKNWSFVSDEKASFANVLYEDVIERGEAIPLLLPMPDLATEHRIKLRYTLVTSTSVDAKDPVEYTKAGLVIRLRPDAERFAFSKRGEKTRNLHLRKDAAVIAALSADGWTSAPDPISLAPNYRGKSEAKLREEGKWDTLRSFGRTFKPGNLFRPRIELSYLAREGGLLLNDAPALSWALLVTVEAPNGSDLHSMVRTQFPVLVPLPLRVPAATVSAYGQLSE